MSYANRDERARLIAGLRALADFLEERQEVPAPQWVDVMVFPPKVSDDEKKREIDQIAALIGSTVDDQTARNLHYTTTRFFGPVRYDAVAIPTSSRTRPDTQSPRVSDSSLATRACDQ